MNNDPSVVGLSEEKALDKAIRVLTWARDNYPRCSCPGPTCIHRISWRKTIDEALRGCRAEKEPPVVREFDPPPAPRGGYSWAPVYGQSGTWALVLAGAADPGWSRDFAVLARPDGVVVLDTRFRAVVAHTDDAEHALIKCREMQLAAQEVLQGVGRLTINDAVSAVLSIEARVRELEDRR